MLINQWIYPTKFFCCLKKKQKNSFCSSSERNAPRCHVKELLGKEIGGQELISFITDKSAFSIVDKRDQPRILHSDFTKNNIIWHLKVHTVHANCIAANCLDPKVEEMVATTFYDSHGKSIHGYTRCVVDLSLVISFIHRHFMSTSSKSRYLFSGLIEESIGAHFQTRNKDYFSSQFNTQSLPSRNMVDNNGYLNQRLYSNFSFQQHQSSTMSNFNNNERHFNLSNANEHQLLYNSPLSRNGYSQYINNNNNTHTHTNHSSNTWYSTTLSEI